MGIPVHLIEAKYQETYTLLCKKYYVEAMDEAEEALSLAPDDPAKYAEENLEGGLYYLLALANKGLGDTNAYERYMLKSIELFPGNCFGYDELLSLYRTDFRKSLRIRWKALLNYPTIVQTRYRWNCYAADTWEEQRKNNRAVR